ncbi:MAG TPA: DUF1819 family protein [Candidatus Saccharibacteria bacterium]|nr:DUF1819 family protein [Candidatus Saccharibacteria bacterium]
MIGTKDVNKYTSALTGELFLFNETRILARYLVQGEDINTLRKRNLSENLIMHKGVGSLKRSSAPIFRRLSMMSPATLQAFADGDIETARLILLITAAKSDQLIRDFILTVYADKIALKSEKINKSDVERYFESIYEVEPSLRDRSESTKRNLKQKLMKIVAEAGLVKKQGTDYLITRPNLSNKLTNLLFADGDSQYIKCLGGNI